MFNFLFDGKIGDILAPVVPSNQLFLAIQHFKNDQIPALLSTTGYDASRQQPGEYSAIHVACRYNNRYALDLLISRGTNLQLIDQNGNTPLHYASKYGHLELCKYLVESGCQVGVKNKQQQSAYDIAESHLVRQYLLPLVLQAERGGDMGIPPPPPVVMTSQPMGGMSVAGNNALGNYSYNASVPAPAPHQSSFPSFNNKQQLPTLSTAYPPATTSSAPASNIQVPAFAPPPHTYSALQTNRGATTTSNSGSGRIIQPDGFHSSASDPVLQQKYGHIIERPAVAPPPTGPPMSFTGYNNTQTQTGNVYNRYVAYDINQPVAPAPQPVAYNQPVYAQPVAPQPTLYPPTAAQPPLPSPGRAGLTNQAPFPHPYQTNSTAPPSALIPPNNNNNSNNANSSSPPPPPTAVNRLLGNKGVPVNISLTDEPVLTPVTTRAMESPSGKPITPFSKDGDDVIQASSNSNSIL